MYSKDVVQFDGQNDEHDDRAKIGIIRHVTEMAETMAEQQEADHAETDPLNIAVRLVAKNGDHREKYNRERWDSETKRPNQ